MGRDKSPKDDYTRRDDDTRYKRDQGQGEWNDRRDRIDNNYTPETGQQTDNPPRPKKD